MSKIPSTPSTPAKKEINKETQLETAWIGWLDPNHSKKVSKSGIEDKIDRVNKERERVGDVRGPMAKVLDDGKLHALRQEVLIERYEACERQIEFARAVLEKQTLKELSSLAKALDSAINRCLSVPANHDKANKAADVLEKRIEEVLDKIAPGMASASDRLLSIFYGPEYEKALQNDPTIQDLVDGIVVSLDAHNMNDFEKQLKELATRVKEASARDVAAEQKVEEVEAKLKELEDTKLKVFCTKDNPKCTDEILDVIREKWSGVQKALAATVNDSTQGDKALRLIQELSVFVDRADKHNARTQKESAFKGPYKFVTDNLKSATKCEDKFADDYKKVQEFDKKKDYGDKAVAAVNKLKSDMQAALAEKAEEWKALQDTANPLIRFAEKLIAGNASQLEVGQDIEEDIRTDEQLNLEQAGLDALARYKEAVAFAAGKDYVKAISRLESVIEDLDTLKQGQAKAVDEVTKALTPDELARREKVFKAALGKRDKKGRIRFDESALDLLAGSMMTTDEEGMFVPTKEYEEMMRVQKEALQAWHQLIGQGIDPVTAGEKAFVGIPYDMWPAEAIRAVAMLRRAEETFAAEREQKELEEELARSQTGLALKAFDKGLAGLEKVLTSEQSTAVQSVANAAVSKTTDALILKKTKELMDKTPGLSKDDAKQKAAEIVSAAEVGKTLEGFGSALGFLSVAASGFSLGKDAAELHQKRGELGKIKQDVEAGAESPVKIRIAEYERNRLIWKVITDAADAILNAASMAGDLIPGLGIMSNTKDLALAVKDATHFFHRLHQAASLKAGAKYDPETMMDMSLAAEAKRAGLLGTKKSFDAAEKLIALLGEAASIAAEAGGISAPGAFAIKAGTKATTMTLHYGAKACFAVHNWKSNRELKSNLAAARAYPIDYAAVEYVFSHSNTYARFALAYGCLNSDPWARRYVLGRGLTEKELDHAQTSVAILREYLNVTFQSHTGEAEEDEVPTTNEEKARLKLEKKAPKIDSVNPEYYGVWQAEDFRISASSWDKNLKGAQDDKLAFDKKGYPAIGRAIGEAESAWNEFDAKRAGADTSYDMFARLIDKGTKDRKAIDQVKNTAKTDLDAVVNAASTARWRLDDMHSALVGVRPLTTQQGARGNTTQQEHIAMKGYLSGLISTVETRKEEIAEFLEGTSFHYKSLQFEKTKMSEVAQETRQEISVMHDEMKRLEAQFKDDIDKRFKERWSTSKFKTPFSRKRKTIDETLIRAHEDFQLKPGDVAALKTRIETALDDNRNAVTVQCYGTVRGHYAEMLADEKEAQASGRSVDKIVGKWQRKINGIVDEKCREGISAFEGQIGDILSDAYNTWASAHDKSKIFSAKNTDRIDRAIWQKNKEEAAEAGWQFKRTGIGPAMDEVNFTYERWQLVPFDPNLQALYRVAHRKLEDAVQNLPVTTKEGFAVEGMSQYRKDLLAALSRRYNEFQTAVAGAEDDSTTGDAGWTLPDARLQKWPLTAEGWLSMHALCKSHDWNSHDENKGKRAFGKLETELNDLPDPADAGFDEAKQEVAEAAKTLQGHLKGWKIKGRRKEKKSPPFAGMVAFRDVTVKRLGDVDAIIADYQKGWK